MYINNLSTNPVVDSIQTHTGNRPLRSVLESGHRLERMLDSEPQTEASESRTYYANVGSPLSKGNRESDNARQLPRDHSNGQPLSARGNPWSGSVQTLLQTLSTGIMTPRQQPLSLHSPRGFEQPRLHPVQTARLARPNEGLERLMLIKSPRGDGASTREGRFKGRREERHPASGLSVVGACPSARPQARKIRLDTSNSSHRTAIPGKEVQRVPRGQAHKLTQSGASGDLQKIGTYQPRADVVHSIHENAGKNPDYFELQGNTIDLIGGVGLSSQQKVTQLFGSFNGKENTAGARSQLKLSSLLFPGGSNHSYSRDRHMTARE
jgi:hypothetical protein